MRARYWWIFGAVQLIGLGAAFEGLYSAGDPIWWGLSLLLLLPGTLVSFPFSTFRPFGDALAALDRVRNRRACKRASFRVAVIPRHQNPKIKMRARNRS